MTATTNVNFFFTLQLLIFVLLCYFTYAYIYNTWTLGLATFDPAVDDTKALV